MIVETEPARCARPECRYPPRMALTPHGIESDPFCSDACVQWASFALNVAHMPWGESAERYSQQLLAAHDFLNARGPTPNGEGA